MFLKALVKRERWPLLFFRKTAMVMQLTAIVLLTACLQISAAPLFAQRVTLSGRNMSLKRVFTEIRQQTGFNFIYANEDLRPAAPVTLHVKNGELKSVLDSCFAGQPLTYSIYKQIIIVKPRQGPDEATPVAPVQGKITDAATGTPLAGVTIQVKGSTIGTTTGTDGVFRLEAPSDAVLVVSFLGYQRQEIPLNGRASVKILMKASATGLNQLVVVGYGSVQKKDLTGAVSSISGQDFKDIPVQRVDQMLQGRAPGVQVTSVDGSPGSGTTIRIRGSRSINASNEPLYVIDGIVGAGDLSTINPADIASIDILKDASAAAIYGSRASNGVIIITTKRGQAGKDRFNFSATYGVSRIPRLVDMMGAKDFVPFVNEAYIDQGKAPLYPNPDSILAITGPEGTNWQKELLGTGRYANYNLSVSGGSKDFSYRLSGNLVDQKGVALNSSYKRYQTNLNLIKHFNSKFSMGMNLNLARYRRAPGSGVNFGSTAGWKNSILALPPTMAARKPDGSPEDFNPIAYFGGGIVNTSLAQAEMITEYTTYNDLLGTLYATYEIINGLTFKSSVGVHLSNSTFHEYEPSYLPSNVASHAEFGYARTDIGFENYILNENTLTYQKNFGKHSLNVLGGVTYQDAQNTSMSIRGGGITNDIVRWNDFASIPQEQRNTSSSFSENKQVSFIGRIQYNYAEKYYATFTNRYDGASNFAENRKSAYFPSFALKWRVSEEDFFKNLSVAKSAISDLSARFSYGLSGNQGIANYQSLPTITANANAYSFGGVSQLGYTQGNLANNNLSWETSAQLNTGIDVQLFNGRVGLTSNYYNTRTKDLLLTVQIPTQTGYSSRLVNIGKTLSEGFEFGLKVVAIDKKDFEWSANLNLSTNRQRVLDLGTLVLVALDNTGYGATTNYLKVGVPIGANFGLKYAGVWHNQAEIDAEQAKPLSERTYVSVSNFYKPGKQKYYDYNHDGVLNIDDYHYLGTPNPPLYGGLGNHLRYKHLSMDFFLEFQNGSTMWNYMQFFTGVGLYLTNQMEYMKDRWTPDNTESNIPTVNSRDNIPSTYFLQNSSFLRLKSLTLSYDLSSLVFKNGERGLNVFLSGTNLFLITRYNGYDPEVNTGGTSSTIRAKDNGAYPNSRTISAGVNLNF